MPILTDALRLRRETAGCDFDVGVATRAITIVLNRLGMNIRFLKSLVFFLVLKIGEEQCGWMELRSWLLHFIETAIIVVDVGIAARAIGLVNDASVPLHVLAIMVPRRGNSRCKSSLGYVSESRRLIHKHLFNN